MVRRQAADVGREHDLGETLLSLEVEHIDGRTRASARAQALNKLRADISEGHCRIVTNARCLTEGVDVPALDAVLFMQPRRSKVEIVQAVGRVMRSAPGKKRGYIVLPVIVPEGKRVTDADFLRSSEFQPVWDVISALRAHDDRMDVWVNTADIGGKPPVTVIDNTGSDGDDSDGDEAAATIRNVGQMSLPLNEEIASALVERCGDKRYWASWGDDVGAVTNRIRARIENLLDRPDRPDTRHAFDRFLDEMRHTINEHLQAPTVIGMLASHLVTLPVFEALFGSDQFAQRNPVVSALNRMVDVLDREGLVNEARDLDHFYQSVKTRVREVTDPDGRLRILLDLYESFFQRVEPKLAAQAGIAYTPIEVVDFILRSADSVSRQEFGRGLTDQGVHILDPFVGTGTFPYRLLTLPDLVTDQDLARKYTSELHANEWIPLSYYIAAVKIEQGYMTRRPDGDYQPFSGVVLTDTFELNPQQPPMPTLSANSQRARKQAELPIQVIVGNPPWLVGQKDAGGDNPNIPHPDLEERIRQTYAARSKAQLRKALMDLYKMSIRWATDRIGDRGIVAFVTPNGYLDGNAESGMRACLADEYTTIHIFNLRGNMRLREWRREGGQVFGATSQVGVAITVMVRNPDTQQPGCRIHYRDIGDYLTREQKLQALVDLGSVDGIDDWQLIEPDQHHDWINQRDPTWNNLIRLGHKHAKARKPNAPDTAIRLYSVGINTGRNPYLYSFDSVSLADRAEKMIDFYEQRRRAVLAGDMTLEEATDNESTLHVIKWSDGLRSRFQPKVASAFDDWRLRIVHYRPFVKQWLYYDPLYIERIGRIPDIFPGQRTGGSAPCRPGYPAQAEGYPVLPNQAIYVTAPGNSGGFSALVTASTPDLHLLPSGQAFPRYRYETVPAAVPGRLDLADPTASSQDKPGPDGRVDNITDWCLNQFQQRYNNPSITKDDIWAYIYGILHAPDWRTRYAHNLRKGLPRIPFAPDFGTFRNAGQALIDLHLGYETCEPWPLTVSEPDDADDAGFYRVDGRMRWGRTRDSDGKLTNDRSVLHINRRCSIEGIPNEAHLYKVNGRTPLEWAIGRLKVTTDNASGITNDPNRWHEWADQPYNLIVHLQRIVRVSVETQRIISRLPAALADASTP